LITFSHIDQMLKNCMHSSKF